MIRTHDFFNGFYYEDEEGERISEEEYYQRQWEEEKLRQGQHYILIKICEGIINENRTFYYRRYKGDSYLSLEVEANKKLKVDKVEEVCGFFLCTVKGRGTLCTREEFRERFLL